MAKYLGSLRFPLKCLKCGHDFQEEIARLETDPDLACPACGVVTHYDAEDLRRAMKEADEATDKLADALRDAVNKLNKP
jgi:predicted  nucleic acid-binding Zn-ribbon protein